MNGVSTPAGHRTECHSKYIYNQWHCIKGHSSCIHKDAIPTKSTSKHVQFAFLIISEINLNFSFKISMKQ